MVEREAINYIDQAAPMIGHFQDRRLEILGGEPFIELNPLLHIVRHAADMGFRTELSTNGFWATDVSATKEIVSRLREAGVRMLVIVTDSYHLGFVSIGNIKTLLDALRDSGLIVNIVYRVTKKDTVPFDLLELRSVNVAISEIIFQPWLPIGSPDPDSDIFAIERGLPPPMPCRSKLRFIVSPAGDVYPCLAGIFAPALRLGNSKEDSLSRILEYSEHNDHLRTLANLGPMGLISRDDRRKLERVASMLYADNCWLCQYLLSNGSLVEAAEQGTE
jgi:MoaA/NifB/PqqE/SkfB family radical SAM enzyme